MKKTFKRAGVAVLSMAMLLSMGAIGATTASAVDNGTVKVTSDTHLATKVTFYKVAQQNAGAWEWTNAVYETAANTVTGTTGATTFTTIGGYTDASDKKELASALARVVTGAGTEVTVDAASATTLAKGYYVGIPSGADAGYVFQPVLVEVKNDSTEATDILEVDTSKGEPITLTKTIEAVANETGTAGTYADASDGIEANNKFAQVEAGSKVTYKLKTQIPVYDVSASSVADFVLTDTPESTLVITPGTVKVYLSADATLDTTADTLVSTNTTRETAFDDNAKYTIAASATGITATFKGAAIQANTTNAWQGKYVFVTFDAIVTNPQVVTDTTSNLTTSAAKEAQGNKNGTSVTFGNNFATGGGSETLTDETYVYSTALKIFKVDENNNPMTTAAFTLTSEDGKVYTATKSGNEYTFSGLSAGDYTLKETTVPEGYKKMEDTTITITNTTDDNKFSASGITGIAFTAADSAFDATVENEPLNSLPGTGGMGTVLFTVGGAAVVLLAGFLFVVYMRRRKVEE